MSPTLPAAPDAIAHRLGLALVLSSSLLFSTMSVSVVLIARDGGTPLLAVVASRFASQFLFTLPAIPIATRWAHADWRTRLAASETWIGHAENRVKLFTRGAWGIAGLSLWFASLSTMPMAEATAITYTNIPLSAIFAHVLLGEAYTHADAAAAILAMVGVVLVAQPASLFASTPDTKETPPELVLMSLAGACCSAMAYISARRIGTRESALIVVLYFASMGCIVLPIAALVSATSLMPPTARSAWLQLIVGACGWAGQVLLNAGLQRAPSGPATVMRYCDLVIALLLQQFFLDTPPNALKVVGCVCVMSTVGATLWKTHVKARDASRAAPLAALVDAKGCEGDGWGEEAPYEWR